MGTSCSSCCEKKKDDNDGGDQHSSAGTKDESKNKTGNNRKVTLAIVGLDNAGKTVTTKVLQGESLLEVVPTIGFTNVQFKLGSHDVTLYDLGGGEKIRAIWKNYFAEVHGLVFVVDSSRRDRVVECKDVLASVVGNENVRGKPLLVLANKQDLPNPMNDCELSDVLQLNGAVTRNKCLSKVICCAAISAHVEKSDEAIRIGFEWLLDAIDADWSNLSARVERDIHEQKEREKKERLERLERVQKQREQREKEEGMKDKDKNINGGDDDVDTGNPFKRVTSEQFKKKEVSLSETTSNSVTKKTQSQTYSVVNNDSVVTADSTKTVSEDRTVSGIPSTSKSGLFSRNEDSPQPKGRYILAPLEMTAPAKKKKGRSSSRNKVSPYAAADDDDDDVVPVIRLGSDIMVGSVEKDDRRSTPLGGSSGRSSLSLVSRSKVQPITIDSDEDRSKGEHQSKLDSLFMAEELPGSPDVTPPPVRKAGISSRSLVSTKSSVNANGDSVDIRT